MPDKEDECSLQRALTSVVRLKVSQSRYNFSHFKVIKEKVKYNARAHSEAIIGLEITYQKYISSS